MTTRRQCAALLAGAFVLLSQPGTAATEPQLQVAVNRQQVYLGESFLLEISASGAERPPEPDLTGLANCRVRSLGSRDSSSYSITIVNGRMERTGFNGRVFSYEITPLAAGECRVGPLSLTVDGRQIVHPGATVTVNGIAEQDRVLITVSASHETALVDEPFAVTLQVLIRRLPDPWSQLEPLLPQEPPELEVPYLSGEGLDGLLAPDVQGLLQARLVSSRQQPGLAINHLTLAPDLADPDSFFNALRGERRLARFALDRREIERDGQVYYAYSLKLDYTPRDEGNYVFGPVVFKGPVPVAMDDQGRAQGERIFAVGSACTVRIVPPPEEGRPESFTGILGTGLQAAAELDAASCKVGDPLNLTLTLSGPARFEKSLPPKLNLQTNMVELFTVYDHTVQTIKDDEHRRRYVYTLRPNRAGVCELPPIAVSYYDTGAREYRVVFTRPLPLTIQRGAEVTASQLQGRTNLAGGRTPRADPAAAVPAPMHRGPPPAAGGGHPAAGQLLVVGAAGPAAYLLAAAAGWARRRRGQWRRAWRRRRALARAARALARPLPADAAAGRAIRAVVGQYLADRLNVPTAGLAPADLRRRLAAAGVSAAAVAELAAVFEHHFNAGFTAQKTGYDCAANGAMVWRLLQAVDRELRL